MNNKIQDPVGAQVFGYNGEYSSSFNFQNVNTYNSINNYLFAQLCGLIYADIESINKQVEQWNAKSSSLNLIVDVKDVDSFRFMVLSNQDFVIVVFRGSSNLANWLTDFDIILTPFENMENNLVHQGFYLSVLSMLDELQEVITERKNNAQNIYITGHSLGAAQAIISAFACPSLFDFVSVTTFGEPKIGDSGLITSFNLKLQSCPPSGQSKLYRVVNGWDPIPSLPLFYKTQFYYHEGCFYLYAKSEGDHYDIKNTSIPLNPDLIDHFPMGQQEILEWRIDYHAIGLYISNALANIDNNVF
ncbi:lipase family protein [Aquimarina algicola]|uniref:Lipase family protein n=1 Tax=Aquimarina algicola TaxID=2589995 RepID=A0A504ITT4_9FLAO|nr:lipase family protein [Aquimarina algicola]TPN81746.1 lipase family protein [Aquimarina algicola]